MESITWKNFGMWIRGMIFITIWEDLNYMLHNCTGAMLQLAAQPLHTHRLRFSAARTLCLPATLTWMALIECLQLSSSFVQLSNQNTPYFLSFYFCHNFSKIEIRQLWSSVFGNDMGNYEKSYLIKTHFCHSKFDDHTGKINHFSSKTRLKILFSLQAAQKTMLILSNANFKNC